MGGCKARKIITPDKNYNFSYTGDHAMYVISKIQQLNDGTLFTRVWT